MNHRVCVSMYVCACVCACECACVRARVRARVRVRVCGGECVFVWVWVSGCGCEYACVVKSERTAHGCVSAYSLSPYLFPSLPEFLALHVRRDEESFFHLSFGAFGGGGVVGVDVLEFRGFDELHLLECRVRIVSFGRRRTQIFVHFLQGKRKKLLL